MAIENRSAYHHYFIDQKYTAGLVLRGTEVKSIRDGKVSFNDSYCLFDKGELWVKSLHIAEYKFGTYSNHIPTADRKLLLTKRELRRIEQKLKEKGYTLIPLKIFFTEAGFAKMEIGLAKGKKLHDKRESIKQKDVEREIKRKYGV
ncbi:MAG: SsrA-binding protein SmpB [Dinghuibacter sp.]|nr:SsrA-binding protein SmpB [Dinghuibacter sp.]